jgi:hypothetical protein
MFIFGVSTSRIDANLFHPIIFAVIGINIFGFFIRIIQRVRFHGIVYGSYPVAIIIIRWPVAIVINATAAARAFYQYKLSVFGIRKLKWSKTTHELPKEFGHSA